MLWVKSIVAIHYSLHPLSTRAHSFKITFTLQLPFNLSSDYNFTQKKTKPRSSWKDLFWGRRKRKPDLTISRSIYSILEKHNSIQLQFWHISCETISTFDRKTSMTIVLAMKKMKHKKTFFSLSVPGPLFHYNEKRPYQYIFSHNERTSTILSTQTETTVSGNTVSGHNNAML